MKKVLFSLLLGGISLGAHAQTRFDLHAGTSLYNISNMPGSSNKVGFTGGIGMEAPIASNFYFQPELNFQMQGAKYENPLKNQKDLNVKMNYLNVPILFKYRVQNTGLGIYVGPQVGFNLSAQNSVGTNAASFKDQVNTVDFAGSYGLEYEFPLQTRGTGIVLSARYTTGFTSVFKDQNHSDFSDKSKNNGFAFTLGYRF